MVPDISKKVPRLYLVCVNQMFHSPAVTIPYDPDDHDVMIEWLVIEPWSKWLDTFCDQMKDLIKESKRAMDDDQKRSRDE